MNIASILGAIATVVSIVWHWQKALFTSQETLPAYMLQAGIWGPPIFIFYKSYKTVVPIIPGALTSIAGVYIYGNWVGKHL